MIKIVIEVENVGELAAMLELRDGERDDLRAEIQRLTATPLKFSLPALANAVLEIMPGLTPDQSRRLRNLIESEGACLVESDQ